MMATLRPDLAVICLLVLFAVLDANEIPKSESADNSWRQKLMPRFPSNKLESRSVPKQAASKAGATPFDLDVLPVNIAVYKGQNVTLSCSAVPGTNYRIQWWEYAYSTNGNLVSDNELIVDHPEAARYSIIHPNEDTFHLHIQNVKWEDAGAYVCWDANNEPPNVYRWGLQLIVIEDTANCTTTLSANGIVIEGQYYTAECTLSFNGNIVPIQTWTGPPPFSVGNSQGENSIWSGISWIANRTMDTRAYQCISNFTNNFVPADEMSPHVPDWYFIYKTNQIFVYWGPTNMYAEPIKDTYEVGDVITCYADAFPLPTYEWLNTRTNEVFPTQGIVIDESLLGTTQVMRCQAQNVIQGFVHSGDLFINVTVLALTTTPVPTLPPSTTTAPPVGVCSDLTGRWESTEEIRASLCLTVDNTANGHTIGLLRNDTDTFWIEIVGRTKPGEYELVGFTGIWPDPIGVSGFAGECHRCNGVEVLLVNDIQRVKGKEECGSSGYLHYSPQYTFYRTGPSCV